MVSGSASITSPSSPNSGVTGVAAGSSATLRWSITNACGTTYDDVVLINAAAPTTTGVTICQNDVNPHTISASACATYSSLTAGPNFAGSGTNVTGTGSVAWSNPGNALTDNNSYATVTLTSGNTSSNYLHVTNYGFNIPTSATINGIQVAIGRFEDATGSGNDVRDVTVQLLKAGSRVGSSLPGGSDWPTIEAQATYGNASNLWGTTWTPADINDNNFGLDLAVNTSNVQRTAYVDYIEITVTYTITGSVNWYANSTGGSPIGTGSPWNPVGTAKLPNTNTLGTYTFYAACSVAPDCRTATDVVITAGAPASVVYCSISCRNHLCRNISHFYCYTN